MADDAEISHGIDLTPERLKGLAHPTRVAILGLLRSDGPSTATAIAARLDTNSGATSYHLRQLERHGFIAEVTEAGDGRTRVWEARHRYTVVDRAQMRGDTAALDLLDEFSRLTSDVREIEFQRWLETQDKWGPAWAEGVAADDHLLWLTPSELGVLTETLRSVLLERMTRDRSDAPEGAEAVRVHLLAFPVADVSGALLHAAVDAEQPT